jgi:glycosyltransferase involved in cell wall biosynthesis
MTAPLRVAWFGTYDRVYPRNRVLIEGLRSAGAVVDEYNAPLDPSLSAARLTTPAGAGKLGLGLARAHLSLAVRHRRDAAMDVVVVGYPGHLMMPFGRFVARHRRALLVFDPLVSLYDTFAGDRGLVGASGPAARVASRVDGAAFGGADVVLADTTAHGRYFHEALGVPERRLEVVLVGALPIEVVRPEPAADDRPADGPLVVVQYGKWSPLHGTETVLDAAAALRYEPYRFVLIGEGQMSAALLDGVARRRLTNVELPGSMPVHELRSRVAAADVCLGVFGASDKAARVIPNKVFDGLAAGRPVVTRDSPAARELLVDGENALLVPAADGGALADALRRLRDVGERARLAAAASALYEARCTPAVIGARLLAALEARR